VREHDTLSDHDATANQSTPRRSVLRTAGGIPIGSTGLAGTGRGGAAGAGDGLRVEIREATATTVTAELRVPREAYADGLELPRDTYVGAVDEFLVHEEGETVSLPDETAGRLARPIETRRVTGRDDGRDRYVVYFRTRDVDLSGASGDGIAVGLGLFLTPTTSNRYWDTASRPCHRDA
jgi:hypothetical protein